MVGSRDLVRAAVHRHTPVQGTRSVGVALGHESYIGEYPYRLVHDHGNAELGPDCGCMDALARGASRVVSCRMQHEGSGEAADSIEEVEVEAALQREKQRAGSAMVQSLRPCHLLVACRLVERSYGESLARNHGSSPDIPSDWVLVHDFDYAVTPGRCIRLGADCLVSRVIVWTRLLRHPNPLLQTPYLAARSAHSCGGGDGAERPSSRAQLKSASGPRRTCSLASFSVDALGGAPGFY